MLAQLYHIIVAGYYLYVSNWMIVNVVSHKNSNSTDPTVNALQRFSLRYLTNWTFTLQTMFFVLCLLHDLLQAISGKERLKSKLRNIHTYFFTVLAGPAAVVVTLVFWGIWFIDRNLIFPKVLDDVLPPWINHSLHTTTTLFVIGEMVVYHHNFPSVKEAVPGITAFLGLYTVCLLTTYFQSGIWLYPFLKDLDWNARISFFVGTYLLALIVFGVNKFTNSIVWRATNESVSKKRQKKKH